MRLKLNALAAAALALLVAGCGQGAATAPTAVPAPTAAPAPTSGPTAIPTPGADQFANPVINRDFPDPDLLQVGDTYYAYATNSGVVHVQAARSTDLVTWEQLPPVLPALPTWARAGLTWAPEVTTWDDGQSFAMYFTARDSASDRQCIGVATAASPTGPFSSAAAAPLICQVEQGGSIDASAFRDEAGTPYLLWKNDGNCCGFDVFLYLQQLAPDGLSLAGEPARLITNDQAWEGTLVEAPTLWQHEGSYYLFYSANNYAGADYAIGYAVAEAAAGPYTKPAEQPLLATDFGVGAAIGPGGQDIVVDDDGETWLVYHSWDPTASYRRINLDRLAWEDGRPVVRGPTRGPQPRP